MSSTATRTALEPLRALRYDQSKVDLADVVAPPYDVITAPQREALIRRCDHSVVRLELPDEPTPRPPPRCCTSGRATACSPATSGRRCGGTSSRSPARTASTASAAASSPPCACRPTTRAASARTSTPTRSVRAERLELMRATRTNLSPIFGLYDDPDGAAAGRLGAARRATRTMEATDSDGTVHRFWEVTDPAAIGAVRASMAEREILIADGHHRYETALAYRDERRAADGDPAGDRPYDFILMCLCNLRDEGLAIFPTHRVVMSHREVDRRFLQAFSVRELPAGRRPRWSRPS